SCRSPRPPRCSPASCADATGRRYRSPGTVRPVFVLAMEVDLRILDARSLKDKRGVVKRVVVGGRRRFGVAGAEVGEPDSWQRARLGLAVVAAGARQAEQVIDDVDRFVWSHPGVEVVSAERLWLT